MNHDTHTLRRDRLKKTGTTVRLLAALATSTLVFGSLIGSAAAAHADGTLAPVPAPASSSAPPEPSPSSVDAPDSASSSTDATGDGENLPAVQDPITLPVGNPLLTIDPSTLQQQTDAPDSGPGAGDEPFIQGPPAAPSADQAANVVPNSGPTSSGPVAVTTAASSTPTSAPLPTAVCLCGGGTGGGDGTNATNVNVFVGIDRTHGAKSLDDDSPPDTQIAVGPSYVAEMVNSELQVYTRNGGLAGAPVGLGGLFGATAGKVTNSAGGITFNWPLVTDPKILYDAASGRFFASEMVYNDQLNEGSIKLIVSAIDDPTHWGPPMIAVYTVHHVLLDQPKLAVNDDKVTITADPCGKPGLFGGGCGGLNLNGRNGGVTIVLDKAQAIAGSLQDFGSYGNDAYEPIPAVQLSPQERQYEYHYFKDSLGRSFLQEQYITGTPAQHNLKRVTPPGLRIKDTTSPPAAKQPGTKVKLDTGDDRIESAVYRDGVVWLASGDKCNSSACLRLIQLNADGLKSSHAPTKLQDVRYSRAGLNAFYPAVTTDANQDLIVSYSVSSATVNPSASELSLAHGASFANVIPQDYEVGTGSLVGGGGGSPQRFGDYSGAAPDPILAGNVWVAGEWGAGTKSDTAKWSTAIGQYTFQPPIVEYN